MANSPGQQHLSQWSNIWYKVCRTISRQSCLKRPENKPENNSGYTVGTTELSSHHIWSEGKVVVNLFKGSKAQKSFVSSVLSNCV